MQRLGSIMAKISVSQIATGILGAAAASVALGAVTLASGSDLVAASQDAIQTGTSAINRSAKSDRADGVRTARGRSQTISVRPEGMSGTSILIRVPANLREEARNRSPLSGLVKESVDPRKRVACESVVSVLTEVAKQLQPGRCVT
jgi:hypothetical protein